MLGIGHVIAGKYRVERMLGRGGMGYVVSALHTQLDQRVAVKFMVPELCEHPEAVARFLREARAAVRIHGEHVARVLDVGTLDDGTPYMVMEFLSGRDLASELEERKQLAVGTAVNYILQVCEALAEAHALGIVHRDLKPANLFLTQRPDGSALVKVLDFGISKAMTDPSALVAESLTASQSLIGSPYYMSPEQVRKPKLVDRRSDIWALGVILYELLLGERPFGGDTPMSVLAAVVSDPAPTLRLKRPELPGELEAVIFKCLEKDPEHRYPSVPELAQALAAFTPGGDASAARIAGIWRAQPSTPPISSGASTPPPSAQTGRTMPSPMPILIAPAQPNVQTPHTSTAFGQSSSKSRPKDFPLRSLLLLGLLAGFGALMYALGRSGSGLGQDSSKPESSATTTREPELKRESHATMPASAAQGSAPIPSSSEASPDSAPSAPAASASKRDPLHRNKPAPRAAAPAASTTAPTAPVLTPPAPTRDPLDERR